jgi:hypothetical protein
MKPGEERHDVGTVRPDAGVPDPRTAPAVPPKIKMPWTDGAAAMDIAFSKLTQHDQRHAALARYINLVGDAEAFADELRASTSPEFRAMLVSLLT